MLWTRGMLRAVRPFQTHRVTPRHLETEGGCAEHACPPRQASTSLRGWEISSNHQCCMLLFHQHGRESVLGAIEIFSTHMIAISALTNYPSVNLRSPGTCTSAVQGTVRAQGDVQIMRVPVCSYLVQRAMAFSTSKLTSTQHILRLGHRLAVMNFLYVAYCYDQPVHAQHKSVQA